MKVYELINKIKGTNADLDTIYNWMVMNKICPLDVMEELDEEEYSFTLTRAAEKHCKELNDQCSPVCYKAFLEAEVVK